MSRKSSHRVALRTPLGRLCRSRRRPSVHFKGNNRRFNQGYSDNGTWSWRAELDGLQHVLEKRVALVPEPYSGVLHDRQNRASVIVTRRTRKVVAFPLDKLAPPPLQRHGQARPELIDGQVDLVRPAKFLQAEPYLVRPLLNSKNRRGAE